jgi:hypothetical protein
VDIPADVTTIGNIVFDGCKNIAAITIPAGVASIGSCAFAGCESLVSITIPASVTTIGDDVFFGCKNLSTITVEKQNPRFSDVDGVLFDKIKKRIMFSSCKRKGV